MRNRRTRVWFDGHELTAHAIVSDLRRPLVPRTASYVDVPGMDGKLFTGVRLDMRTVKLRLTLKGDPSERAQAQRALASILNVSDYRPLEISEDSGLYYMAIPTAKDDGSRFVRAESFEVTFDCQPCLRGMARSFAFSLAAHESLSFVVGGTAPTPAFLTFTHPSAGDLTLSLDTGTLVTEPDGGPSPMAMDSERRVYGEWSDAYQSITDVIALPMGTDWAVLEPGARTLTASAATSGTISFIERWV